MPFAIVPLIPGPRFGATSGPMREIFLGADRESGTNCVRIGTDRALMWMPSITLDTQDDPRVITLGEHKLDAVSSARRTKLQNALAPDRTFRANQRVQDIMADLLVNPVAKQWNPIVATREGRKEILVGPGAFHSEDRVLWSQETGELPPNSKDAQDTFNRSDSALSGSTSSDTQFSWSLAQGNTADMNIVSNVLNITGPGGGVRFTVALTSLSLDTTNMFAQLAINSNSWTHDNSLVEIGCRIRNGDNAVGDAGYAAGMGTVGVATPLRYIYDWTGATLWSDADPSVTGLLYHEWSGSTYTVKLDSATISNGTDSVHNTYKKSTISSFIDGGNTILADAFQYADLVAAITAARIPLRGGRIAPQQRRGL